MQSHFMRSLPWKVAAVFTVAIGGAVFLASDGSSPTTGAQTGGPVFVSGDDAEDHCEDLECGGLYVAVLNSAIDLSKSPGSGILAIGMTDDDNVDSLDSWNSPANGGPDVSITVAAGSAISSVDFSDFDVIFVPSNEHDGDDPPGISDSDLALLNARKADIIHFVNNLGGGLIALTEQDADPSLAFGFLPVPLQFQNVDYLDAEPTAALAALAPAADSDNMDHDSWHNIWTGPPGFSGLEVLAVTPEILDENENPSAAILGGAQVVLRGQLDLTPDSDENPVGTQHTVTATVTDPLDSSPLSGIDVDFSVTSGPNSGASGQDTTDANGQATFTYTGNGGPGTDIIRACFEDQNEDEQCDVAEKAWLEPTPSPTPVPTEEPTPVPTEEPTPVPTEEPTPAPTEEPTPAPSPSPTPTPTASPSPSPSPEPSATPTPEPSQTAAPTASPSPTPSPSPEPTATPSPSPTTAPTASPSPSPTSTPAVLAAVSLPNTGGPSGGGEFPWAMAVLGAMLITTGVVSLARSSLRRP